MYDMSNLTIYPFAAPLLADLEKLHQNRSYLPVNAHVAAAMHGVHHVMVSIDGLLLRTELQLRADGQTCIHISNAWITEQGLEMGCFLDIELAVDEHMEDRRVAEAEADAAWLMRPLARISAY